MRPFNAARSSQLAARGARTRERSHTHSQTLRLSDSQTLRLSDSHEPTQTHRHTDKQTHRHTDTRKHTHTHTHTHTCARLRAPTSGRYTCETRMPHASLVMLLSSSLVLASSPALAYSSALLDTLGSASARGLEYGVRAPVFYGLREQTGDNGFQRMPTGSLFCSHRNLQTRPETSGSLRENVI